MNTDTTTNTNTLTAAEQNLEMLNVKPREIKKHVFSDGEFKVPTKYVCTHCGKTFHVRQEVLIKRIEKQYNNSMTQFMKTAICSHCKSNDVSKIDEQIAKLQAKKSEIEAAKNNA